MAEVLSDDAILEELYDDNIKKPRKAKKENKKENKRKAHSTKSCPYLCKIK